MRITTGLTICFLLILSASFASAITNEGTMQIYAVTDAGQGLAAGLTLHIEEGTGKIYTDLDPLVGTSTQSATRTAVKVAQNFSPTTEQYNYFFDIHSNAALVEGPSAGAAMTLLTISLLQGNPLPVNVSITGTISEEGIVGPVGGVFEKAKRASETGIDLFLIPRGESKQIVKIGNEIQSVNLPSYALDNWNIKVIEVISIDDAVKLAFGDIASIDISNAIEESGFIFTPESVELYDNIKPMKALTNTYMDRARQSITEAKFALNGTILEDTSLISVLLASLNSSEKSLEEAELLEERNYFYSAANFAFIAFVNANLVKDVAENPSLLEENSTVFTLKVSALKEKLSILRKEFNAVIPLDYIEWFFSAQQRYAYAETTLENTEDISNYVDDATRVDSDAHMGAMLRRLQDYEFAVGWHAISNDLLLVSQSSENYVDAQSVYADTSLNALVQENLIEIENYSTSTPDGISEEVQRRVDSAQRQLSYGWTVAAVYDSHTALALLSAEQSLNGRSSAELFTELEERIALLEEAIQSSKETYLWPRLFLDHSKYFLASAHYYFDENEATRARQLLESGFALLYLAENLFVASNTSFEFFDAIEPNIQIINSTQIPVSPPSSTPSDFSSPETLLLLLVGVLIGGFLVIVVYSLLSSRLSQSPYAVVSKINKSRQSQRKIELDFALHKIDEQEYDKLKKEMMDNLSQLDSLRKVRARDMIKLEKLKLEIYGLQQLMHQLNFNLKKGLITEKEYAEELNHFKKLQLKYQRRLKKVNKHLKKTLAENSKDHEAEHIQELRSKIKRVKRSTSKKKKN